MPVERPLMPIVASSSARATAAVSKLGAAAT